MTMRLATARALFLVATAALLTAALGCSEDATSPSRAGKAAQIDATLAGAPLSSIIAVYRTDTDPETTGATNLAAYVKALVEKHKAATLAASTVFPLPPGDVDAVRVITGLRYNVLARHLDPLTGSQTGPRLGANPHFTAFLGNGWDRDWTAGAIGSAPQWNGDPGNGWLWSNFEYVSNGMPTLTSAPAGQHISIARAGKILGRLSIDNVESDMWTQAQIDAYIALYKEAVGGGWMRARRARDGSWEMVASNRNRRFDASSNTRARLTGLPALTLQANDDQGNPLDANVVPGTLANAGGGVTPWGTVVTSERDPTFAYGPLETAWTPQNQLIPGTLFDAGQTIDLSALFPADAASDFGSSSDPNDLKERAINGYLVEIDPTRNPNEPLDTTTGRGHQKLGALGRAQFQNVTFAVGTDWKLEADRPIVIYSGDSRPGGRLFKWVSASPYTAGMSRADVRNLLADGRIYAAHFADLDNDTGHTVSSGASPTMAAPGTGVWIEISTTNTAQTAPNAGTTASITVGAVTTDYVNAPGISVGAALQDTSWNGLGGYDADWKARLTLFTACHKLGIRELNRPADVEWNPHDRTVYVAFRSHDSTTALRDDGSLRDPATQPLAPTRDDATGRIFALREADADNPGTSMTFTFWQTWAGNDAGGLFDAQRPSSLVVDANGSLWFATAGDFSDGVTNDSLYYLDIDATTGAGTAYRVLSVPRDAAAAGPSMNADMTALFLSVQHPGEDGVASTWPQPR